MNKQLEENKKIRTLLNERNLDSVVSAMKNQRDQIEQLSEQMVQLQKDFSQQNLVVNNLEQEVKILKTKQQLTRFNSGSTIR